MKATTTSKTTKRRSGFEKGTGCFNCVDCGKLTRSTGEQAVGSKLCVRCWDKAGDDNAVSDGEMTEESFFATYNEHSSSYRPEAAAKAASVAETTEDRDSRNYVVINHSQDCGCAVKSVYSICPQVELTLEQKNVNALLNVLDDEVLRTFVILSGKFTEQERSELKRDLWLVRVRLANTPAREWLEAMKQRLRHDNIAGVLSKADFDYMYHFADRVANSFDEDKRADQKAIERQEEALSKDLMSVVRALRETADELEKKLVRQPSILVDRENASMLEQVSWFVNDVENMKRNFNLHYAQTSAAKLAVARARYAAKYDAKK